MQDLTIDQIKKLHAQMVFIHQRLSGLQYFMDEFEISKDALVTITAQANALGEQIKAHNEAPQAEQGFAEQDPAFAEPQPQEEAKSE